MPYCIQSAPMTSRPMRFPMTVVLRFMHSHAARQVGHAKSHPGGVADQDGLQHGLRDVAGARVGVPVAAELERRLQLLRAEARHQVQQQRRRACADGGSGVTFEICESDVM